MHQHIDQFRQVAEFIQPHPVSASDIKLDDRMGMSFAKPEAMTEERIKKTIDEFAFAAEECHKAGFDGVQLHGGKSCHLTASQILISP